MKAKIFALLSIALISLTACSTMSDTENTPTTDETTPASTVKEGEAQEAVIKTTMGDITVKLFTDEAPETVKNFIELSKAGKYDGTPFHRVIKDFMIQTGDFENKNGTGGYTYKGAGTVLPDELSPNLHHVKGTLSMANRGPNTGASQFFIVQNEEGTPWLDGMHAIFGEVTDGMAVVDAIGNVKTMGADQPTSEILIEGIEIK